MKRIGTKLGLLLLAVATVVVGGCGDVPPTIATDCAPIIGGELDGDAHPYVGTLVMPFPNRTDSLFSRCSGTLIAPNLFLTAGHCGKRILDWGLAREEWGVAFGASYVPGETALRHGAVYLHPSFGGGGIYDVAMIVMEEAVEGITPAEIAANRALEKMSPEELAEAEFTLVGYGALSTTPQSPLGRGTRRSALVHFVEFDGEVEPDLWAIVGGTEAMGGNGDSGGPLLLGDTVYGVIWGVYPVRVLTAATRVETSSIRRFVRSFLEGESYDDRQDL